MHLLLDSTLTLFQTSSISQIALVPIAWSKLFGNSMHSCSLSLLLLLFFCACFMCVQLNPVCSNHLVLSDAFWCGFRGGGCWGNGINDSSVGLGGKHMWYQEWGGRGKFDQNRVKFQFRLSCKFFMLYDGLSMGLVLSVELDNLQATSQHRVEDDMETLVLAFLPNLEHFSLYKLFFSYPVLPGVWIHQMNCLLCCDSRIFRKIH
jgi:hypothetical protein